MRLPVNRFLPVAVLVCLGIGAASASGRAGSAGTSATGPAADYPVVVGEPFSVGGTVWTPKDQLNYDAVGYAAVGDAAAAGVTGAHKTLPLPSYVEVTALGTGKTILVRLERRGPMANDTLIELSPLAIAQLGLPPGGRSPVRVRRVNPPEQERALLRAGNRAPERMETPEGLLKVLRRKLQDQSPLLPPSSTPPAMPAGKPPAAPVQIPAKAIAPGENPPTPKAAGTTAGLAGPSSAASHVAPPKERTAQSASGAADAPKGTLVVQAGAFAVEANARKTATRLDGTVSRSDKFWRVLLGPFTNRAQAAAALEKAKRAGYSDARIQSAD